MGISDQNPPPQWNNSDLRWPKLTQEYLPQWKTSHFRLPKFTLQYPLPPVDLQSRRLYEDTNLYPLSISLISSLLNGVLGMASDYRNISWAQSRISLYFGSGTVRKCPWRTDSHRQQRIIIAKYKQCLLRFLTCPSISLKHSHRSAWRDHHRKVQTFPLSVLDLSINLLKGRTSISSNRSSSQSRNIFSFSSWHVHQFVWRTHICLQQQFIMAK